MKNSGADLRISGWKLFRVLLPDFLWSFYSKMVLSSAEVCMDSADWTQSFLQNSALKLSEDLMSCPRPPMLERRIKPQTEQPLKCPRCDSANTKFCYYNNYNLSQPRHFCKTCRRYWTKGGALRNVPVGGGCRKNKRAKRAIDHPVSAQNEASTSAAPGNEVPDRSAFEPTLPPSSKSIYYGGENMNLTGLPFTRIQQDRAALAHCNSSSFLGMSCGTQSASLEPHLSALNTFNSFKSNNPGLDFSSLSTDQNSLFESSQPQLSRAMASALFAMPMVPGLDDPADFHWKLQQQQQQKLSFPFGDGQIDNGPGNERHDFLTYEDSSKNDLKPEVVTKLPSSSVKVEEDQNALASDWQVPASEPLFAGDSNSYWNGGAWPDITTYGLSVSPLI